MNIKNTRSSGRSAPLLLAPAEGLGALRALLGAFGPLLNSSIQKYTLGQWCNNFLVQVLAIRETVAPLAKDPIMLGTSIWLFRHLKH